MGNAIGIDFDTRQHNRYWWYRIKDNKYTPPIFALLTDVEQELMGDWFSVTEKQFENPGEMSVPAISFLAGLVGGNGISSIVQCGHYAGYSTLLLGFLLRSMGKTKALFSIDIDPEITAFTEQWVCRAGLQPQVKLQIANSADPGLPDKARSYFGRDIQMVVIDSSHQYAHTMQELDLWYAALPLGGLIVLHDVSRYAQSFDATRQGGVRKALLEWSEKNSVAAQLLNSFVTNEDPEVLTYRDGCGLAIIQKQTVGKEKEYGADESAAGWLGKARKTIFGT